MISDFLFTLLLMSAKHEIPDGIIGRMGGKELVFGEHLVTLPDANSILDNPDAMRRRLADEAFLFFRGLHDPKLVARARRVVCGHRRSKRTA